MEHGDDFKVDSIEYVLLASFVCLFVVCFIRGKRDTCVFPYIKNTFSRDQTMTKAQLRNKVQSETHNSRPSCVSGFRCSHGGADAGEALSPPLF